jgi:hypothetical protein
MPTFGYKKNKKHDESQKVKQGEIGSETEIKAVINTQRPKKVEVKKQAEVRQKRIRIGLSFSIHR